MTKTILRGIATAVALAAMAFPVASNADEMTEHIADVLAPQYIYMELCKDWPPLPPDRLRSIDTMTDMVDKEELKKSTIKMMFKLKLDGSRERTAAFCSKMSTMIKNEPGHDQ